MRPFPPLVTLAIVGCLLVPFEVSRRAPIMEPYPAVLLPSGADQVRVDEKQPKVWKIKLWGKNEHGAWIELDSNAFLSPIPVQYLEGIMRRDFGFKPAEALSLLGGLITISRPQPSQTAVSQTRAWLRAHLRDAGATPSVLRMTIEEITVEVPGGRILSEATAVERLYRLDEAS